jgi:D-beta-D-heptose 7-phosphate kinase / D-beta-D-heptose 1-phosphate adenosyltransferase
MFDFEEAFQHISEQTVLCVGDLMLDDFVYGEVTRISPEAPTPVLAVTRSEPEIGGAGNVARNIAALGARCLFVGIIGEDAAARTLTESLAKLKGSIVPHLVVDAGRHTTRKVRFVSEHHSAHLMRADWETARPVSAEIESAVIAKATAAMPEVGAVVLSDYAKGVLTPRVISSIIDEARRLGKPVVVDPKGHDYSIYRGATLITPNRQELGAAIHRPVTTEAEIAKAAAELSRIVESDAVLVTRSEEGMTLHVQDHAPLHIPAYPVKVRDVSGAGDTVAAVMAALLAMKAPFDSAMRAANAAAAVVVGKRGTAVVSLAELRHRILPAASLAPEDKIVFDWSVLDERLAEWRRLGLRVGFTNGCFDILHRGHTKLLAEARAACDRLVVGLNSDASTTRLKGKGRPINPAGGRAEVLAALEAVDLVVVFEEDTPLELIKRVRPAVLIKGADYKREQVVGREVVEQGGGDVVLVDLVPGHSTTAIVERARPAKLPAES